MKIYMKVLQNEEYMNKIKSTVKDEMIFTIKKARVSKIPVEGLLRVRELEDELEKEKKN